MKKTTKAMSSKIGTGNGKFREKLYSCATQRVPLKKEMLLTAVNNKAFDLHVVDSNFIYKYIIIVQQVFEIDLRSMKCP